MISKVKVSNGKAYQILSNLKVECLVMFRLAEVKVIEAGDYLYRS
jgi:hypothetical protein